jgi:hypothetical protein
MTTMIDEKLAHLRTHRNNISRYRRLLKTNLTELEREYIEHRLSDEQLALETLIGSTFPISFKDDPSPALVSGPPPAPGNDPQIWS